MLINICFCCWASSHCCLFDTFYWQCNLDVIHRSSFSSDRRLRKHSLNNPLTTRLTARHKRHFRSLLHYSLLFNFSLDILLTLSTGVCSNGYIHVGPKAVSPFIIFLVTSESSFQIFRSGFRASMHAALRRISFFLVSNLIDLFFFLPNLLNGKWFCTVCSHCGHWPALILVPFVNSVNSSWIWRIFKCIRTRLFWPQFATTNDFVTTNCQQQHRLVLGQYCVKHCVVNGKSSSKAHQLVGLGETLCHSSHYCKEFSSSSYQL